MGIKSRISYTIINAIKHSRWYTQTMFPDCSKFWELSTFNLDVVNLGSTSGVCAFDYEELPVKGANWALHRNYLSGDKAILENYLSFLKTGATVIMPLCPFSSLSGGYNLFEDRYYTILYPSSIPGFSKARQMTVLDIQKNPARHFPAFQVYVEIRRKLTSLLHRPHNIALSEPMLKDNAQTWLADWLKEFGLHDLATPFSLVNRDGMNEAIKHLNAMISLCRERNFKPILVLPPMYHALAEKFSLDARQRLIYDMVQALNAKDVSFLDYMDNDEFSHDATLFTNAYLMNATGARKFTYKVLKDTSVL